MLTTETLLGVVTSLRGGGTCDKPKERLRGRRLKLRFLFCFVLFWLLVFELSWSFKFRKFPVLVGQWFQVSRGPEQFVSNNLNHSKYMLCYSLVFLCLLELFKSDFREECWKIVRVHCGRTTNSPHLIYTNCADKIACSGVRHVGISDHSMVFANKILDLKGMV